MRSAHLLLLGATAAVMVAGCSQTKTASSATTTPTTAAASTATTATSVTSSTAVPAASTTTVNLASFGEQYLSIMAPTNAALNRAEGRLTTIATPTAAQYSSILGPVITATEASESALLHVTWPPQAEIDVRSLVANDGSLVGDMQALGVITPATRSSVLAQFGEDAGKENSIVNTIRADLGLPGTTPAS
jgi:hypothetical protein